MNEYWKLAKGYEKFIAVSNQGNVVTTAQVDSYGNYLPERLKTVYLHKSGYKYILLSIDGKQKFLLVHRLVAETFLSNPHNFKEVNHKDLNKGNANVNNLEWCSREYNMKHASEHGAFKSNTTNKVAKAVTAISRDGSRTSYHSVNACAKAIGGFSTNVSACLKGKIKTYKGYTFEYI